MSSVHPQWTTINQKDKGFQSSFGKHLRHLLVTLKVEVRRRNFGSICKFPVLHKLEEALRAYRQSTENVEGEKDVDEEEQLNANALGDMSEIAMDVVDDENSPEPFSPVELERSNLNQQPHHETFAVPSGAGVANCPICQEPADITFVLPCKHLSHSFCLSEWFIVRRIDQEDYECPLCRAVIRDLKTVPFYQADLDRLLHSPIKCKFPSCGQRVIDMQSHNQQHHSPIQCPKCLVNFFRSEEVVHSQYHCVVSCPLRQRGCTVEIPRHVDEMIQNNRLSESNILWTHHQCSGLEPCSFCDQKFSNDVLRGNHEALNHPEESGRPRKRNRKAQLVKTPDETK
jgi:hypothetical protein